MQESIESYENVQSLTTSEVNKLLSMNALQAKPARNQALEVYLEKLSLELKYLGYKSKRDIVKNGLTLNILHQCASFYGRNQLADILGIDKSEITELCKKIKHALSYPSSISYPISFLKEHYINFLTAIKVKFPDSTQIQHSTIKSLISTLEAIELSKFNSENIFLPPIIDLKFVLLNENVDQNLFNGAIPEVTNCEQNVMENSEHFEIFYEVFNEYEDNDTPENIQFVDDNLLPESIETLTNIQVTQGLFGQRNEQQMQNGEKRLISDCEVGDHIPDNENKRFRL